MLCLPSPILEPGPAPPCLLLATTPRGYGLCLHSPRARSPHAAAGRPSPPLSPSLPRAWPSRRAPYAAAAWLHYLSLLLSLSKGGNRVRGKSSFDRVPRSRVPRVRRTVLNARVLFLPPTLRSLHLCSTCTHTGLCARGLCALGSLHLRPSVVSAQLLAPTPPLLSQPCVRVFRVTAVARCGPWVPL